MPESLISLEGLYSTTSSHLTASSASLRSKAAPNLSDSEADAELANLAVVKGSLFQRQNYSAEVVDLKIQLVDDRSQPERNSLVPARNVHVKVIGSDFSQVTDAMGIVQLQNTPENGRYLIQTSSTGEYMPTLSEVRGNGKTHRIKLIRKSVFGSYASALNVVQDTRMASLCGRLLDQNGVLEGLGVEIKGARTLYTNQYHVPDARLDRTSSSGRFCIFNIPESISHLDIFDGETHRASFTIAFTGGYHLEEDLVLGGAPAIKTSLAMLPSAYMQQNGSAPSAANLLAVDQVDLAVFGYNDSMSPLSDEGYLGVPAGREYYKDKVLVLADGGEFEPVIYQYDVGASSRVTPLLPFQFVQDLHTFLAAESDMQVAFSPELGSMIISYGKPLERTEEEVEFRVLDASGYQVESGWYYGTGKKESVEAVFFNLPEGLYAVQVRGEFGTWLDATTATVKEEAVTYVQLGSFFELKSKDQ